MGDFNLALVIVEMIICVIVMLFNVYLQVNYKHFDNRNQDNFPKVITVLNLSIVVVSILMLSVDVANQQAYHHAIYNVTCNLKLLMKTLLLVVFITDVVLVFFFITVAMFYYGGEGGT